MREWQEVQGALHEALRRKNNADEETDQVPNWDCVPVEILKDVKPPIWRRVVTKDCTLAKLHDIIQVSMG